jgi:hypothetical protein
MGKLGAITIAVLMGASFTSFAQSIEKSSAGGGDVCDIRPDLCGGSVSTKKKKSRQAQSKKKKCRAAGDEREVVLHLPVCDSEAAQVASDIETEVLTGDVDLEVEFDRAENTGASRTARRQQAFEAKDSKPQRAKVGFSSYLQENANHPALTAKRTAVSQTAFVETKRAAIAAQAVQNASAAPGSAGTAAGIGQAPGIAPAAGIGAAPGIPAASGAAGGATSGSSSSSGAGYDSSGASEQLPPGSAGQN